MRVPASSRKLAATCTALKPGDHVALHTLANCGHCRALRNRPSHPIAAPRSAIAHSPFQLNGKPVSNFAATSTFAERTVVKHQQAVKIDPAVPLDVAMSHRLWRLDRCWHRHQPCRCRGGETPRRFLAPAASGSTSSRACGWPAPRASLRVDLLSSRETIARDFGAHRLYRRIHRRRRGADQNSAARPAWRPCQRRRLEL